MGINLSNQNQILSHLLKSWFYFENIIDKIFSFLSFPAHSSFFLHGFKPLFDQCSYKLAPNGHPHETLWPLNGDSPIWISPKWTSSIWNVVSDNFLLLAKDLVIESMRVCPAAADFNVLTLEKSATSETSTCKITVCENCLSRMSLITTGKSCLLSVPLSQARLCHGMMESTFCGMETKNGGRVWINKVWGQETPQFLYCHV